MTRAREHLRRMAGGLPAAYWWLWSGSLVNRMTGFIVPFVALWLTRERGLTAAEAGAVAALYGGGGVVSTLVGGVLADRVGRRATMLAGLTGSGAAVLALALSGDAAAVAAGAVLLAGFFGELYRPAVQACIADLVPPSDRDRAYGLQYWGVNMGFAVGGVVAGLLASISYVVLFAADAATTVAFALIVAARVPETRPAGAGGESLRASIAGLGAAFRDRTFVGFLALQLALFLVFLQLQTALPLDMAAKGLGPGAFGVVLAVNGVLIAVVQPFAPAVLRRFERRRVVAAAALVVGVGFALHAPARDYLAYSGAVAVWTLGEIAWLPTAAAIVADLAPQHLRGRYQGAYAMTVAASAFAAPLFGPAVLERAGSGAFWTGCLAVAVAVGIAQRVIGVARAPALRTGAP